jgi:hypothetical protein
MQGKTLMGSGAGLAWVTAALLWSGAAAAEEKAPAAPPLDPQLEARLAAEKDARKECKTNICKVFATRSAEGAPITCDVTKTFLGHDISEKILSGKISWPWGAAQCTSHVDLDRAALAKLISQPEATMKLKPHELKCVIDKSASGGASKNYVLKLSIAPEVTFKNGRATKVKLNWGKIDAPLLAKSALWSATAIDSTMNVVGASAVRRLNAFIYEKCKEVGVEVAQPKTQQPKTQQPKTQ